MKEDSFYRYMYIPFYQARVPFRIYSNINKGFIGEFMGIEFSSIALTDRIMTDELMLKFFRERGLWVVGSRTLLTTFASYNQLKADSAKQDNMGEYGDINIFSFQMDTDYLGNIYTNLCIVEGIINKSFGVKLLKIVAHDTTTPSIYFRLADSFICEDNNYVKNFTGRDDPIIFNKVVLSTFSVFFDVYVDFQDLEDRLLKDGCELDYIGYFKNFVPLENFAQKFLSELFIRTKVNFKDSLVENSEFVKNCEFWLKQCETDT